MSKPRTPEPQQNAARAAVPAAQRLMPLAYRVDDAAQFVSVSKTTVWRLIQEGRLPARRLDGSTIIRHKDLTAFIDGLPLVRQLAEPSTTLPPPPAPTRPDKQAPYGRGRTGKPFPPPNPNGWAARTLCRPSEQLAAIVGADPISRPKALEAIWKHIRASGLQRESDMRVIYADDKLRAVAGTDVITMYALEALIRPHLEPIA